MDEITKQQNADLIRDFCFMQALYSASSKAVSTKEPGNLRDQVNTLLEDNYHATGADRIRLNMFGEEVGSLSLVLDKPSYTVINDTVFNEWAVNNHYGHIIKKLDETKIPYDEYQTLLAEHPEWFTDELIMDEKLENISPFSANEVINNDTAEIIPGVAFVKGGNIKNTKLNKFDADKVFRIMATKGLLNQEIAYALESE